jgi:hypothetical protein
MTTLLPSLLLITLTPTGCFPHDGQTRESRESVLEDEARQAVFVVMDVFDLGRRDVRNFTFSPKPRRLYVSFMDRKDDLLYEWDVDKGKITHKYQLGAGYMCDSIAVSPDGTHLVVGCWPLNSLECKTLIISTTRERDVRALELTERTFRPKFSADGSLFWTDLRDRAFALSGKAVPDARYRKPKVANRSPWRIEPSKMTIGIHGLYYRDGDGRDHHLTQREWHENFCITQDKRFVIATTWDGELIAWQTDDCKEVFRRKLASQYGYLAYDPDRNRVLLGDATSGGTTFLRALVIGQKVDGKQGSAPDKE